MKIELERRIAELSREIRNYPTPIARCDEQLAGLIEERAELLTQLNEIEMKAGGCTALGLWTNDGGFNAA
jgi:chorismate mutase